MAAGPRPKLAYPPSADPPIDLAPVVRLADFEVAARERLPPGRLGVLRGRRRRRAHPARVHRGVGRVPAPAAGPRRRQRRRCRPRRSSGGRLRSRSGSPLRRCTAWPTRRARRPPRAPRRRPVCSTWCPRPPRRRSRMSPRPHPAAGAGSSSTSSATARSSRELVRRAEAAGYEAICLTVDLPVLGYRDAVVRCVFDPGEGAYANLPQARGVAPDRRHGRQPRHAGRRAHVGCPRRDPVVVVAAAGPEGDPHRRGRRAGRRARRGRRVGLEPRRPPAGPDGRLDRGAGRGRARRRPAARRSTSTAACDAAPRS